MITRDAFKVVFTEYVKSECNYRICKQKWCNPEFLHFLSSKCIQNNGVKGYVLVLKFPINGIFFKNIMIEIA